ncbi:MAG: hypothetical protein HZC17_05555 [Candidatus Omnitrophica bacterium]|nr:hypothetical protein [Candidatus Omnitrophota bacterium]
MSVVKNLFLVYKILRNTAVFFFFIGLALPVVLHAQGAEGVWISDGGMKAKVALEFFSPKQSLTEDIVAILTVTNIGKVSLPGRADLTAIKGSPVFYAGAYYSERIPDQTGTFLVTVGLPHDLPPGGSFSRLVRIPASGNPRNLLCASGWLVRVDDSGQAIGCGVHDITVHHLDYLSASSRDLFLLKIKKQFSVFLVLAYGILMGLGLIFFAVRIGVKR